jgi:hypothetical protein
VNSAVPSNSPWLDPPPQAGGPPWAHGQSQVTAASPVLHIFEQSVRVHGRLHPSGDTPERVHVQELRLLDQELLDPAVLLAAHLVREGVDQAGDHPRRRLGH